MTDGVKRNERSMHIIHTYLITISSTSKRLGTTGSETFENGLVYFKNTLEFPLKY